ncbi:hypothetical protein [Bacillus xiapuensis]|uniref:hypothetical protein n=1 Tax=Bacillus xiapuensis TaxID=2014075 RepID=UPI000C23BC0C|nr:hypothetical protein [Bacillus xiapuensis]
MGLESIDMQLALSRSVEAGKTSQQHQQHGQLMQEYAGVQAEKEREKKRKTVVEKEEAAKASLTGEEGESGQPLHQNGRKKKAEEAHANHPYKGQQIDVRG